MSLGLQKTKIYFVNKVEQTNKLLQKGSLAIVLKANDTESAEFETKLYEFRTYEEALKKLKTDQVKLNESGDQALELAFRGAVNRPFKVYVVVTKDDTSLMKDVENLESVKFDWFCAPEFELKAKEISDWVIMLNEKRDLEVKAVVSNYKADSEYIVNFTTNDIVMKKLASKSNVIIDSTIGVARVTSALCGTPLTRAITNLHLEDISSVERLSNEDYDTKIDNGELVLFNDWDKVRFGRGVNSLTTLADKNAERKKILIISKMHLWKREVKEIINEKFLGAFQNSIDEKMLLVTAIKEYNNALADKGVILQTADSIVDIDIEAQEDYLVNEQNIDTSEMTEKEIRDAKTDTFVFIKANLLFTDAMEDIIVKVAS